MNPRLGSLANKTNTLGASCLGLFLLSATAALAQEPHLDFSDPPSSGGACSTLCVLLTGMLLGVSGQIARSVVGIKKELDAQSKDTKWKEWFNTAELVISLLLGAGAGTLAAVGMWGTTIDKKFLLACVAAGYAGSDFIQGFMQKNQPSDSTPASVRAAAQTQQRADAAEMMPAGSMPKPKTYPESPSQATE